MWNPDAILRVQDIHHKINTQERLDKAAATQMVFEDALFHIIDYLIRKTGSNRLVLTGGTALNALANMHMLEHFDEDYYRQTLGRRARLHLWVPPTPSDSGVTIGAAYMFAYLAGAGTGSPLVHAFYCGSAPTEAEIRAALGNAPDIAWTELGDIATPGRRNAVADFMAFMTAKDGVFARHLFFGVMSLYDPEISSCPQHPAGPLGDFRNDLRSDRLDLLVGHGLVPRLQGHGDRDRFLAGLDALALVDVEHRDVGDQLAIRALRRPQDVRGSYRAIDHEGEVALDRLERRKFQ